jgi:hypothetical protein
MLVKPTTIKFKIEKSNAGIVTVGRNYDRLVLLKNEDGTPVRGGELVPGQVIRVDIYTGMMRKENDGRARP